MQRLASQVRLQQRTEPQLEDSDLPLATRRARRSTKQRRYDISGTHEDKRDAPPKKNPPALPAISDSSIWGFDVLPKMPMLPTMAPHLYLHGHQQLPDDYSMACVPFTAVTARPRGPLQLFDDQLSMHVSAAQGIPAWQLPLDTIFGRHNQGQRLAAGHDGKLMMQGNPFDPA
jgi:hypothetical protein